MNIPNINTLNLNNIAKPIQGIEGQYSDTENAASIDEVDIVKGPLNVVTDYLKDTLLEKFDKTNDSNEISYADVEITAIVLEEISGTNLKNIAEITEDADEHGNPIEDVDSTPGNKKPEEDDQDYEDLITEYFDLALRKFITHVNDDSDPTTTDDKKDREPVVDVTPLLNSSSSTAKYSHPKTPVLVEPGDLVTYKIRIYNEGSKSRLCNQDKRHITIRSSDI